MEVDREVREIRGILLIGLILIISGCAGGPQSPAQQEATTPPSITPEPEITIPLEPETQESPRQYQFNKIGDIATIEDIEVRLIDVKDSTFQGFEGRYFQLVFSFKNNGKIRRSYANIWQDTLVTDTGQQYPSTTLIFGEPRQDVFDGSEIFPGVTIRDSVFFRSDTIDSAAKAFTAYINGDIIDANNAELVVKFSRLTQ